MKKKKKERKKWTGFSCLQGLDTIINITLVLCFVNECDRYVIFADVFNVAFVLYLFKKLILAL